MLKRFLPRLLFVLTLLASSGMNRSAGLMAQDTIGFAHSGWSGMPPSVYSGTLVTAGAFVKNLSLSPYPESDTIEIRGYIDTLGPSPYFFNTPPLDSVHLYAMDSAFFIEQILFNDNYQGGHFRIGNNIIVVWPILYNHNFVTGDSLRANVLLMDTINSTGPEFMANQQIRCYPIPSSGPLYITSTSRTAKPVSVIVHDSGGKVIAVSDSLSSGINTDEWAPGIYILEITMDDHSKSTIKIIRQ